MKRETGALVKGLEGCAKKGRAKAREDLRCQIRGTSGGCAAVKNTLAREEC